MFVNQSLLSFCLKLEIWIDDEESWDVHHLLTTLLCKILPLVWLSYYFLLFVVHLGHCQCCVVWVVVVVGLSLRTNSIANFNGLKDRIVLNNLS